jgi:hypothetical protein
MLSERDERPPEGLKWHYELKLDGFRAISRKSGQHPALVPQSERFHPPLSGVVKRIAELPSDTVIDGEIVALDVSGKPSFNLLQGFGVERQRSCCMPSICSYGAARMCGSGRSKSGANNFARSSCRYRTQSDIRKRSMERRDKPAWSKG